MLIQQAYIKLRSQFGKQCFFEESDPIVEENILPDPELMQHYIHRSHCHRGVQKSEQFALHEMQTASKVTKESGMLHTEGGWPKEINMKDEEAVQRFRRRVEKDENWAPRMKKLTDPMQRYILQNNAVNIYENYFDDMVPTELILPRDMRTTNVYANPQSIVRPVSHLSWSPGAPNRLAGSYTFMEFETQPPNVNPCSYIWDIANPNKPVMTLKSHSPLITIEFNPRDPSMLISGMMSGQVCNWDIRIGNRPAQISPRQFSHRNPANQALWITSKTNTEFFSASTSGTIKWWDIRNLRQPSEELVMDLDDPLRADVVRAIGVTTLQFEPTMGSRFLVGTVNGTVINVNRKAMSTIEKLGTRFNCHVGPVIAIDRNPFIPKNFLTVGDWTVKIWADDTKESSLISIRSRYSVFFTISATGLLEVYDLLIGVDSPVTAFRVCNESLTAIAPHEDGQILALGSRDGNIYLVECSEGHIVNTRTDKANIIAYLERCSHFEKAIDSRLKEIRLTQATVHEESIVEHTMTGTPKGKPKKGNNKERKDKVQVKERSEQLKRRIRMKKTGKEDAIFMDDVITEAEAEYFRIVEEEFMKHRTVDDFERMSSVQEMARKKRKREPLTMEDVGIVHDAHKPVESAEIIMKELAPPKRPSIKEAKAVTEDESVEEAEEEEGEENEEEEKEAALLMESKRKMEKQRRKRRKKQISRKVCVEVCKPEICCADMEEERKIQLALKEKATLPQDDIAVHESREPSDLVRELPERSAIWKTRLLLEKGELLANVLAREVEDARKEMRAWQERIVSGKRDSGMIERSEGKKAIETVEDDVSHVREDRTDFQQLAETDLPGKSEGEEESKHARDF